MGQYLDEVYKDGYFAIGTDFVRFRHKMCLAKEKNIRLNIIKL